MSTGLVNRRRIPVECCGVVFPSKLAHKRHRHEAHGHQVEFTCDECGKVCRSSGAFARHTQAHDLRRQAFWNRVVKHGPDGCWIYTGNLRRGYGRVSAGKGRDFIAHRYAYLELVGPVPEGLTLDHLCRDRRCVNPAHLEPVTIEENLRRAEPYRERTCALCGFVCASPIGLSSHMRFKHPEAS